MIRTSIDEQELFRSLNDLGMDSETIRQFMQSIRLNQWENGKRILSSYRSKLLTNVHETQDKLYNMDFLIRKLKTNKALYDKGDAEGVNL